MTSLSFQHDVIGRTKHTSLLFPSCYGGLSGGAKVLGNLLELGRPTIWMIVGQGHIALAGGAGEGLFGRLHSPLFSLLFLPLFGRRTDID